MQRVYHLRQAIRRNYIFRDLEPRHIRALEHCAYLACFESGEWIFRKGNPADAFYLIRHGRVRLTTNIPRVDNVTVQTLQRNDILGWSWLFPPYEWHFDAQALGAVDVILFEADAVRGLTEADHELGYQLMRRFAEIMLQRMQFARMQMFELNANNILPKKVS